MNCGIRDTHGPENMTRLERAGCAG
jgi:hypothetical protein